MVNFLAGAKGDGKSRKIIEMANANVKVTDGHLVFITHNRKHMHDLHRDVRFVETEKGLLANYREFIGFVLGILSQNSDITHIYVDGINSIICNIDEVEPTGEDLAKLKNRLDELSKTEDVGFSLTLHCNKSNVPEAIKAALI